MIDRDRLDLLRVTAHDAVWAGDYERALRLHEEGLGEAAASGNRELEDLFTCNRSAVLMEMDRDDFDLSRLKEILLRSSSGDNGARAAHVCARAHEMRGEFSRARFYANAALQRSRERGLDEILVSSYNLLGNLELREGRFDAARDFYREALNSAEARAEDDPGVAAQATDNLGYCHIALGRLETGADLVRQAVGIFGLVGARQALDYPCLDLSLAHIRMGRLDEAEFWGQRALSLGHEFARADVIKNAHFLLGEAYFQMGRPARADEHFGVLADHYPDLFALKDLLRQVSLLDLINLI